MLESFDYLRAAHREWSCATFGDGGPVGSALHLAEEAAEVADNPGDLSEYADCVMLLWDMIWRANISDADLKAAIAAKLERNKARTWGRRVPGKPCHHVAEGESNV